MDGHTRVPRPARASPPPPAGIRRLAGAPRPPRPARAAMGRPAEALGRAAPDAPLARRLHLAVAELDQPGLSALAPQAFTAALAPLRLALSALESVPLDAAGPAELAALIARID